METAPSTSADLGPSITCFPSGKRFYLYSPTFDIEDIAHHLSMQCRYAGAVRHFYSVAEHSVLVSLLMQELKLGDPMEGLMHDAHEAYIGDLVRPWKTEVKDWAAFEHRLESELRDNFMQPTANTFGCDTADSLALFIESWFLKADRGRDMSSYKIDVRAQAQHLVDKCGWTVLNLLPSEAEKAFMKRYNELRA